MNKHYKHTTTNKFMNIFRKKKFFFYSMFQYLNYYLFSEIFVDIILKMLVVKNCIFYTGELFNQKEQQKKPIFLKYIFLTLNFHC